MEQNKKYKKSKLQKLWKILKKEEPKTLTLEELQNKVEENEDEILHLSPEKIEELQALYQKQTKALEDEIKLLQTQKNMYLFNIHMYEKCS